MIKLLLTCVTCMAMATNTLAQHAQNTPTIYKISQKLLAGQGLNKIRQADTSRTVYQKKVYDGVDLAVYMVAIGTGITNEFKNFPLEEFVFWMNGEAIVEPEGEEPFAIYSGDYFIQPKGFVGKWNFVDIGGVHLELSVIAKNRPDSSFKSPMAYAMVLNRDIISGVHKPVNETVYRGPELTVRLIHDQSQFDDSPQERMFHVLSGVLTIKVEGQVERHFYPGDFFVVSEGGTASFSTSSVQGLRVLEVYKTKR